MKIRGLLVLAVLILPLARAEENKDEYVYLNQQVVPAATVCDSPVSQPFPPQFQATDGTPQTVIDQIIVAPVQLQNGAPVDQVNNLPMNSTIWQLDYEQVPTVWGDQGYGYVYFPCQGKKYFAFRIMTPGSMYTVMKIGLAEDDTGILASARVLTNDEFLRALSPKAHDAIAAEIAKAVTNERTAEAIAADARPTTAPIVTQQLATSATAPAASAPTAVTTATVLPVRPIPTVAFHPTANAPTATAPPPRRAPIALSIAEDDDDGDASVVTPPARPPVATTAPPRQTPTTPVRVVPPTAKAPVAVQTPATANPARSEVSSEYATIDAAAPWHGKRYYWKKTKMWYYINDAISMSYTKAIMDIINPRTNPENWRKLNMARDVGNFCPGYASASQLQQEICWIRIIGGIMYYESAYNPQDEYQEKTGEWSVGLLAMSGPQCPNAPSRAALKVGVPNLECGVELLVRLVAKAHILESAAWGASQNWSTIRPSGHAEGIATMAANFKRYSQ